MAFGYENFLNEKAVEAKEKKSNILFAVSNKVSIFVSIK